MKYKIKTPQDYKKAVYDLFASQEEYARFLHTFHPESRFDTLSRTVQRKANGETKISNQDIIILNLVATLLNEIKK